MNDGTPQDESRQIDAVCRYLLPYPVAALYRRIRARHEPTAKLWCTFAFNEGLLRFLAYLSLADAIARGAPTRAVRRWLRSLRRPGGGTLLRLLTQTTGYLAEARVAPFLPEIAERVVDGWADSARGVVETRNDVVHRRLPLSEEGASLVLEGLREPLAAVVRGALFLRRYALGVFLGDPRRRRGRWVHHWYASRGQEETCDPLEVEAGEPLCPGVPVLLDPVGERGLYLEPLLHWGRTVEDDARHLLWIESLAWQGARYRHPVDRRTRTGLFCDPADPFGPPGVGPNEYVERRSAWPGVRDLRLTADARTRLLEAEEPRSGEPGLRFVGRLGGERGEAVWEARQASLGDRRIVLRRFAPELARDEEARTRFQREARVLEGLGHPAVATVLQVGVDEQGTPFVLTEYIEGEDLRRRLDRDGAFRPRQAVAVMRDVLDALAALHEAGIALRGVKPTSFVLGPAGVRAVEIGPGGGGLGQQQSDLVHAGSLLQELLTAGAPEARVPTPLRAVVERATAGAPGGRYETATEMRAALEQAEAQVQDDPAGAAGPPQETGLRAAVLHDVFGLHLRMGALDAAWCTSSVLSFLGEAGGAEAALHREHLDAELRLPTRPLGEAAWRRLVAGPGGAAVDLAALPVTPAPPDAQEGGRPDRVVTSVAAALGLGEPVPWLRVEPGLTEVVALRHGRPPALLVRPDFAAEASERERAFLLTRQLVLCRPEYRWVRPGEGAGAPVAAAEGVANRMALVVCGDLTTAAGLLQVVPAWSAEQTADERVRDLLLYALSPELLEARAVLAVAIDA